MQGRGRGNVAAERLCGALFVGLTTLKGYFYTNLGGTLFGREAGGVGSWSTVPLAVAPARLIVGACKA
jgi:hypothetical protein